MEDFDLSPPHDINAEQCVIGAMMMSPAALAVALEMLEARDFFRPAHQIIFSAIVEMFGRGKPVDFVTVAAELTDRGEIGRVGGGPYLHDIQAGTPTASNVASYAKTVLDRAKVRRVQEAAIRIDQLTRSNTDPDDMIDQAQAALYEVAARRGGDGYVHISEIMPGAFDEIEAIAGRGDTMPGCPTGFADLDDLTQGLHPGQMVIVAARPAIGKSTLALDFARAASVKHNLTSVMFSLEMSRIEIAMRLMSAEARVALHALRAGTLHDEDWQRLARRMPAISEAPLFIDDSPNATITDIRAKCRRLKQQHDLRLIVVDYLQLMSSGVRTESRQVEVSEFSRRLKLLAKELEVPLVALSQLNRGPEQRTDKKPMMSDLRESGSLEQDADLVILLHREDAYEPESPRAGEADLIVAKHRNGPTRTVTVAFQGHYSRFVDMATDY